MRRVGLLMLLALGCSDPLAPVDVAGTWTLHAVNGQALPFSVPQTVGDDGANPTLEHLIYSDTLVFHGDGTWSESGYGRLVTITGDTIQLHSTASGTYHGRGNTMTLTSSTTESASVGSGAIVRHLPLGEWEYQRVH